MPAGTIKDTELHREDLPRRHVDWSLSALLSVQAITLFIAIPLGAQHPAARALLDICRMIFTLVCVTILTRHRIVQVSMLLALALLAAGPLVSRPLLLRLGLDASGTSQHDLIEAVTFAFNTAVTAIVAVHVFGPGRVTAHRVQGAVLLYLNIAALFAIAFGVIVSWPPGAIILTTGGHLSAVPGERTAALTYFSLTTMTTTGFGDIVPVHTLARSLANLEAVVGQLFPATLLARIVALNLEHSRRPTAPSDPGGDAADLSSDAARGRD